MCVWEEKLQNELPNESFHYSFNLNWYILVWESILCWRICVGIGTLHILQYKELSLSACYYCCCCNVWKHSTKGKSVRMENERKEEKTNNRKNKSIRNNKNNDNNWWRENREEKKTRDTRRYSVWLFVLSVQCRQQHTKESHSFTLLMWMWRNGKRLNKSSKI